MGIRKYKYYFAKPKSEIVKDILVWLLIAGGIMIAGTSPYFVRNLLKAYKRWKRYPKHKVSDTFYRLRKRGFIQINKKSHQVYISLTPEGRKKAGVFQIDSLKVKRPARWDRKWRMLLFDIPQTKRISREALRGKLKELGFVQFQKSAWVYPFDCTSEMELLRDFFGLSEQEMCLIVAEHIAQETTYMRKFRLSS